MPVSSLEWASGIQDRKPFAGYQEGGSGNRTRRFGSYCWVTGVGVIQDLLFDSLAQCAPGIPQSFYHAATLYARLRLSSFPNRPKL